MKLYFFSLYSCNKEEKLTSGNTAFTVVSTLLYDRYVPNIFTWETFIKGYTTVSQDSCLPDIDLTFATHHYHVYIHTNSFNFQKTDDSSIIKKAECCGNNFFGSCLIFLGTLPGSTDPSPALYSSNSYLDFGIKGLKKKSHISKQKSRSSKLVFCAATPRLNLIC